MATLTVRNLDDAVKHSLRIRAAEHGVSMEEEARRILQTTLASDKIAEPAGKQEARTWHLSMTAEEILKEFGRPAPDFDQKAAFDDLYSYLDDE